MDAGMSSASGSEPHEKAYAGVAQDKLTCLNGYGKFQCSLCENAQSRANQSSPCPDTLLPSIPALTAAPVAADLHRQDVERCCRAAAASGWQDECDATADAKTNANAFASCSSSPAEETAATAFLLRREPVACSGHC